MGQNSIHRSSLAGDSTGECGVIYQASAGAPLDDAGMYTTGIDNLSAYVYISAYTEITDINVMSDARMEEEPKMKINANGRVRLHAGRFRVKEGWR
jgi:hypothetical protein